jgi:hypothetical protein
MGVLAGLHFSGFDDDEVVARLRDLAFGFMDEIARSAGVSHWVEKTAFDIFDIDGIEKLCGEHVQFVGIIRHPLDVAMSCVDFCQAAGVYPAVLHPYIVRYPQPVEAFARSWIDAAKALISLGERRPDQVVVCRYEDLVAAPHETISDVLGFLGAPEATDFISDALTGVENLGFSDHKSYQVTHVHQASVDRWTDIPSGQVDRLAPLLNPFLEQCGYDPLSERRAAATTAERRDRYQRSLAVHAIQRETD